MSGLKISRARAVSYSLIATAGTFVAVEIVLALVALAYVDGRQDTEVEPTTGTRRVLAIGDSFTYGLYLDSSDSYPAQLEGLLNQKYGLNLAVYSGGRPGSSPPAAGLPSA